MTPAPAAAALVADLLTSGDGQWFVVRRGRAVAVYAAARGAAATTVAAASTTPVARFELASDDADLAFVGPPHVLVAIERDASATRVAVYPAPAFAAATTIELDRPLQLAATTGPRFVLLGADGRGLRIVRTAGAGLGVTAIDIGDPVSLVVGFGQHQLLVAQHKRYELWDAPSARPLGRTALPLPEQPAAIGPAASHLWASRLGSRELSVFRLSDGRPFPHALNTAIERVISHPASPTLALITSAGPVRLNCFAHAPSLIALPPGAVWTATMPYALLPTGDEVALLGLPGDAELPWRVAITRP